MANEKLQLILAEWQSMPRLVRVASTGVMAVVGKGTEITRKEVCANQEVLTPLIKHLGAWAFGVV